MERQARRRRPSFWRDFGEYVKIELIAILKIVSLALLCVYILVSLPVGMYYVAKYILQWMLTGRQPNP